MTDKNEKKESLTESDKIWEEIKNLPIAMFSLPDQLVKHHVQRVKGHPTEVFLKLKSSGVIANLEFALAQVRGKSYSVEVTDLYTVVRRNFVVPESTKPEPFEQ